MKQTKPVKTKPKTIFELSRELKFPVVGPWDRILRAYADCHEIGGADLMRNLDFLQLDSVTGIELKKYLGKCIPRYNAFDGTKTPAAVVEAFGEDAEYFIAREGSPCIYIKPKGNFWLDRDTLDKIEATRAEEFFYSGTLGMFRLWWD